MDKKPKPFKEFLKEDRTRKKFLSYSLDRQDEIIDRINRERFRKEAMEAEKAHKDAEKNPHKYYWY